MNAPSGYKLVEWDEVNKDQTVWVLGTSAGKPRAYGPHVVDDAATCTLRNRRGRTFKEPYSLLVKE